MPTFELVVPTVGLWTVIMNVPVGENVQLHVFVPRKLFQVVSGRGVGGASYDSGSEYRLSDCDSSLSL